MFGLIKKREPISLDIKNTPTTEPSLKAYIKRAPRHSVYKEAQLDMGTGSFCRGIVLDHSRTGVRIRFATIEPLPEYVDLKVYELGINTEARVVWQDQTDVGLEFI